MKILNIFKKKQKTDDAPKFKIIKANTISELNQLIEADKFFDAFDFELYYKIKNAKK